MQMQSSVACVEAIIGPMFAGKSTELLRRVRRARSIGRRTLLVVHELDHERWPAASTVAARTHAGDTESAVYVRELCELDALVADHDLIAIDEAQFFPDLVAFIERHEHRCITIVYAGLDGDANRRPFGQVLFALPLCDDVQRLTAYDMITRDGAPGVFSLRLRDAQPGRQVQVGADDRYAAVSRATFLQQQHDHASCSASETAARNAQL